MRELKKNWKLCCKAHIFLETGSEFKHHVRLFRQPVIQITAPRLAPLKASVKKMQKRYQFGFFKWTLKASVYFQKQSRGAVFPPGILHRGSAPAPKQGFSGWDQTEMLNAQPRHTPSPTSSHCRHAERCLETKDSRKCLLLKNKTNALRNHSSFQ